MSKWVEKDLFGGKGKVTIELVHQNSPPHFEVVLRCTLAPGGSVGLHQQEHCDEVVVVLAGIGKAVTHIDRPATSSPMGPGQDLACMPAPDSAFYALKPGVVVPVPLGARLALQNTSRRKSLRYLIIKARP